MRYWLVMGVWVFFFHCKTSPPTSSSVAGGDPSVVNKPQTGQPIDATVKGTYPDDAEIEKLRADFFARPADSEELYRIFITSDGYVRKQVAHDDKVQVKEDLSSDQAIADEFKKFDMVNSLQEGQLRIELYPTTGKFYRVRQARPSVMKETDKIMSEDITRWQFKFAKNEIQPNVFKITYQVLLRKKITREQALKILSEQNNKKK